jgi:2-dehydro-3-deoxyphosphooctonate aldolase (KDO 8-P synthase)
MSMIHLKRWNLAIGAGQPLVVIAGVNVLENLDMALAVGRELKANCEDLGLPYVFKASFDKANRSSITSYRGPGIDEGLKMLAEIKAELNVPVCTDIHEIDQAERIAAVAELVQIPAFLCRQTDLVVAAARATAAAGGWMHVKKGQFLAPWDSANIIKKAREAAPDLDIVMCERGVSFGYNNLVVDMLGIGQMQKLGVPVTIDATHAVQLPGADHRQGRGRRRRRRRLPRVPPGPRQGPVRRPELPAADRVSWPAQDPEDDPRGRSGLIGSPVRGTRRVPGRWPFSEFSGSTPC